MPKTAGSNKWTRITTAKPVVWVALASRGALGCSAGDEAAPVAPSADLGAGANGSLAPTDGSAGEPGAPSAAYRVPVRVHRSLSELTGTELDQVLDGVNAIWAPARVCFDFEVVDDEAISDSALDLFFTAGSIPGSEGSNGVYRSPDDIWTIDAPTLNPAPHPAEIPAARTAAHELGHALGLPHQNCDNACPCEDSEGLACDDFLMRSGTLGTYVSAGEIEASRAGARTLGEAASACDAR